jgi:hypothetical protein
VRRSFSKELEEDREFEIGGEVFKFVYPHWREGAELFDRERQAYLEKQKADSQNGAPAFSFVEDTKIAIETVPMGSTGRAQGRSRTAPSDRGTGGLARAGDLRFSYATAAGLFIWGWEQRRVICGRRVLSGASSDMSLEDFLHASYALLVEEHQRINPLKDLLSLSSELMPSPASEPLMKTAVASGNDQSLAQLNQMMAGVKKGR